MEWFIDGDGPLFQLRLGVLMVIMDHGVTVFGVAVGATVDYWQFLAFVLEMNLGKNIPLLFRSNEDDLIVKVFD